MNLSIAVFGSSIPKEGEYEYEFAKRLGYLIGEKGWKVITGGYQGIMDAVSYGCAEAKSEALGVTVKTFSSIPSRWLTKEIKTENIFHRLEKLITLADAYIILPGGTGTLVELSLAWECINKNICFKKPLICYKSGWERIVVIIKEILNKENRNSDFVFLFEKPEEAIKIIYNFYKERL